MAAAWGSMVISICFSPAFRFCKYDSPLFAAGTGNAFTSCLAEHGVDKYGFSKCTNAIYKPLYGGTSDVVRAKKNLAKSDNIRDNMSLEELCAVEFAEMLSRNKIDANNLTGNGKCEIACKDSSRQVANLIVQSKKSYQALTY
jgi:hypothetical protein